MQRPVMNPTFLEEAPAGAQRWRALRIVLRLLWRVMRIVWRVLSYDPLHRRLRIEEGAMFTRALRGLAYRIAFVPVLIAGVACLIVWWSTHPKVQVAGPDTGVADLYHDRVTFLTSDQVILEGALYPVLDAQQVLEEKEQVLLKRYPAVVLVHDFGMKRSQMVPLIRPLHDAGFVVLAMNLRGNGGSGPAAQTFGLREALDVKAAVEMLRRRSFVDGSRIVIVAAGTGATAALIHAKEDRAIPAMVITDPIKDVDSLLDGRLTPRHPALSWLRPLCKWTFELAYQLDVDDADWSQFERLLETRPVLVLGTEGGHTDFTRPKNLEQIRSFLVKEVLSPKLPVVKVDTQ